MIETKFGCSVTETAQDSGAAGTSGNKTCPPQNSGSSLRLIDRMDMIHDSGEEKRFVSLEK
jgi:hypothetical protein